MRTRVAALSLKSTCLPSGEDDEGHQDEDDEGHQVRMMKAIKMLENIVMF